LASTFRDQLNNKKQKKSSNKENNEWINRSNFFQKCYNIYDLYWYIHCHCNNASITLVEQYGTYTTMLRQKIWITVTIDPGSSIKWYWKFFENSMSMHCWYCLNLYE
jgi:hypothetical protein